jgi:phosphatidylserine synthase
MSTYSEIKKLQKGPDKDGYIVYYFYRKFSVLFSIIFVNLGLSANFVTFLSLVADAFAVYFLFLNFWITAAIFVQLAIILDCSDGEVARYYKTKIKNPKETHYGGYLDEVVGTISFSAAIFFTGYFIGSWQAGLFAMSGLLILIVSSLTAKTEFPNKTELAQNFEKKVFGKTKGRIGFTNAVQRILISFAIIFQSELILIIFGAMAYLLVLLKFYLYRNQ